jgi:hypothetical protein
LAIQPIETSQDADALKAHFQQIPQVCMSIGYLIDAAYFVVTKVGRKANGCPFSDSELEQLPCIARIPTLVLPSTTMILSAPKNCADVAGCFVNAIETVGYEEYRIGSCDSADSQAWMD